jgi:hypothetical protein
LLDQPVDNARHAELSDPDVRFGDFDPLDRLRLVSAPEQLSPNLRPVLTQVALSVVDGHPVHTRAALEEAQPCRQRRGRLRCIPTRSLTIGAVDPSLLRAAAR